MSSKEDIEEERHVLYVALTRAKDELIITRRGLSSFGFLNADQDKSEVADAYFLNNFPEDLADVEVFVVPVPSGLFISPDVAPTSGAFPHVGIVIDLAPLC